MEKELDGDESKDGSLRRKVIPRGPIVVITNSSSCEDVHSAEEEDEDTKLAENPIPKISEETETTEINVETMTTTAVITTTTAQEKPPTPPAKESDAKPPASNKSNAAESKNEVAKTPQVPARSKLASGPKSSEKSRVKSAEGTTTPPKKKKSYPTPSVPPRMSKHLPARRTRSDPGAPDQPSRIPRPITSAGRTPTSSSSSPKTNAKNSSRSPKLNANKKLKFSESPKSSRGAVKESPVQGLKSPSTAGKKSPARKAQQRATTAFEDNFVDDFDEVAKARPGGTSGDPVVNGAATVEFESDEVDIRRNEVAITQTGGETELAQESNNLVETFEAVPNETAAMPASSDGDELPEIESHPKQSECPEILEVPHASAERSTNPFRQNDTNPFKSVIESKNPFVESSNPFEEGSEVTPALQPKGQMSASLIAPPIPER